MKYYSQDEAKAILKTVFDSNIFFQNHRFMRILNTINLAFSVRSKSLAEIAHYMRSFMQLYQFRSDVYRLYYLTMGNGIDAIEQFRNNVDQKYLLRQIKAVSVLLTGKNINGAASVVDYPGIEKCVPTHQNPILLVLYGHRLAVGGSFRPAQSIFSYFH
jgi:hypothetical protein